MPAAWSKYLEGFALTVAAMASPAAMERVAFEAAEDALDDGVVLAEFRIAPLLFEAHGVPGEAVIEALLAGLKRSKLPSGLIVCGMRHLPPEETERAARLALKYQGQGVVAFDLAGAEFGHPPGQHASALRLVRDAGLAITLHAAEADGPMRVLEAAELGATRIGHGVHLDRGPARPGAGMDGREPCASVACTWRSAPPAMCTPVRPLRWPRTPSPTCGTPA